MGREFGVREENLSGPFVENVCQHIPTLRSPPWFWAQIQKSPGTGSKVLALGSEGGRSSEPREGASCSD